MNNITVSGFLNTLFPPDMLPSDERPVVAYKDSFKSAETGEHVDFYRQLHPTAGTDLSGRTSYFCLSTVERQRKRQIKKRLEDVRTAFALVLDDIGTKSELPPIPPSWQIETSEGNYQWGYLIEPYDVSTPAGASYFDSVLVSLAVAGFNDMGFRSASRLARLPGSVHRTGWQARITDWNPERFWDLENLFADFNVPLLKQRPPAHTRPGRFTELDEVDDPVLDFLRDNDMILSHNDQWVHIECPWREHHTDGIQGATSTSYSPQDYGREGVGFKCMHGHCADRKAIDFMEFVLQKRNKTLIKER